MSDSLHVPHRFQPTPEQQAIQTARVRRLLVLANAGAAKTTTLALRTAQALARGADPARILILTHTDAAVLAMRLALRAVDIPDETADRLRLHSFDDFGAWVLEDLEGRRPRFFDTLEPLRPLLRRAVERRLSSPSLRHAEALEGISWGSTTVAESLFAAFDRLKGRLLLETESDGRELSPALADELGEDYPTLFAFRAWEDLRVDPREGVARHRQRGDATRDLALRLIYADGAPVEGHPLALGLGLVLVDEMHDMNRAMFTVLKGALTANPRAAFVGVGDRDQVTADVAGADARFMGELLRQEIGDFDTLPLSATFRHGDAIAAPVGRLAKKASTSRRALDSQLRLVPVRDAREEAALAAAAARETLDGMGEEHGDGRSLADTVVLLRHPLRAVLLESHLLDRGIDYDTLGFLPYLQRPETLFVRGLIAHAFDGFAEIPAPETRRRMLEALLLFSQAEIDSEDLAGGGSSGSEPDEDGAALDQAEARDRDIARLLTRLSRHPALIRGFIDNHVLRNAEPASGERMRAALAVLTRTQDGGLPRDDALREFALALQPQALARRVMVRRRDADQVAASLQGLIASAADFDSLPSFVAALNDRDRRLEHLRHRGDRGGLLRLAAIEAVKGLEFEHVIVPGLSKGEFAADGDQANNRNLLYIAMTRARQRLTLLHGEGRASQFLRDAGLV